MPDQLTRRFQQKVALIGDRAAVLTARGWVRTGNDEADIAAFEKTTRPALIAAKTAAVATGVAYYATRTRIRPRAIKADDVDVTADPREPFIAYWTALKNGHPLEDAQQSGLARAGAIARNLATSAARLSGAVLLERAGRPPGFWIRVPDGGACDFCIEIANEEYRTAEAADIGHDRCGCSIEPAY